MSETTPSFGDNVRIRATPLTERLGFAGLSGSVNGETTPSVTGVEVIGELTEDSALSVMFGDDVKPSAWFPAELVEFVDHDPGTVMEVAGASWIRRADGEWALIASPQRTTGFLSRLLRYFRRRSAEK